MTAQIIIVTISKIRFDVWKRCEEEVGWHQFVLKDGDFAILILKPAQIVRDHLFCMDVAVSTLGIIADRRGTLGIFLCSNRPDKEYHCADEEKLHRKTHFLQVNEENRSSPFSSTVSLFHRV